MDSLVILGPTAVGKSKLGIDLSLKLDGEILSIDSRQAYKHIDIGTAKPKPQERRKVPHHLIDILELSEKNNAERFAGIAKETMENVISRHRLPILVGGSGFYLNVIFEGLFRIDLDEEERAKFNDYVKGTPTEKLYGKLLSFDPESADKIHSNDRYRIVRALEIYTLSGITLSEHFRRQKIDEEKSRMHFQKIGLNLPRAMLHERINRRTKNMIDSGWVEEVEGLLSGGADPHWPGLETLGYPEVISYINKQISRKDMIEKISSLTRQYAKRQVTWFRREKDVTWLQAGDPDTVESVLRLVRNAR
ncbi:MAG: tRNA (adenosine(37)-N6)-dimethylallyltransferase MiaA [Candidatus Krumholzibacteria bacterium]|nr:tRNA (adenosine(37)-N6)-dimethylallyltransferase MiaA [Candidatus Krumholzibacteria bacterium]